MRVRFITPLAAFAAAAALTACGNPVSQPVPPSMQSLARTVIPRAADHHGTISCGGDHDDCGKIRLVAPLDARVSLLRGAAVTLSLSSTQCRHEKVRLDHDGTLPLQPQTFENPRPTIGMLFVSPMSDPCRHDGRHRDAVLMHPMILVTPTPTPTQVTGNTSYYLVELFQAPDGSTTLSTVDGSAYWADGTLTFSSPVPVRLQAGTYAFYLAKNKSDKDDD